VSWSVPTPVAPPKTYAAIGAETSAASTPSSAPVPRTRQRLANAPIETASPAAQPTAAAVKANGMICGTEKTTPQIRFESAPVTLPASGPRSAAIKIVPTESRYSGRWRTRWTTWPSTMLSMMAPAISRSDDPTMDRRPPEGASIAIPSRRSCSMAATPSREALLRTTESPRRGAITRPFSPRPHHRFGPDRSHGRRDERHARSERSVATVLGNMPTGTVA
jgi:hypothetical protein